MKEQEVNLYVCPSSRTSLTVKSAEVRSDGDIVSGVLASEIGNEYRIEHGVPDLTYPPNLSERDEYARSFYDDRAEAYDANLHLTFKTHGEDEQKVRNQFVDALELGPNCRVLEVSCGTGRDSEIISQRFVRDSQLCLQEITPTILERWR